MATQPQQPVDMHGDAQMWQSLQGGTAEQNPYLPFLQPKIIQKEDGTRVLRIPKNQTMLDLAKFFDAHNNQQFKNSSDFVTSFFKWRQDEQKTQYDINKPYFKATTPKPQKVGKFKMDNTTTGGLRFTQEQADGTSKPITAAEYALLSGQNVLDILAQDKTGNSQKVIDETKAIEQQITDGKITPQQGLDALIKAYPWVYGSSR